MTVAEIDQVLLVGGSSRIPRVQSILTEMFPDKELCRRINPDEAIAVGAAMDASHAYQVSVQAFRLAEDRLEKQETKRLQILGVFGFEEVASTVCLDFKRFQVLGVFGFAATAKAIVYQARHKARSSFISWLTKELSWT